MTVSKVNMKTHTNLTICKLVRILEGENFYSIFVSVDRPTQLIEKNLLGFIETKTLVSSEHTRLFLVRRFAPLLSCSHVTHRVDAGMVEEKNQAKLLLVPTILSRYHAFSREHVTCSPSFSYVSIPWSNS